jgi:hypothetical protein
MRHQNPQYGNTVWGPRALIEDPNENKAFGSGMGGNSIQAVGGGFKEKNTLKMIGKTAAQIVGTAYGGPAGGMAAGMAVDAIAPDKQSVKSGTSGFGSPDQKGGGSQTSMQQGGSSNLNSVANLAADQWKKYQLEKQSGPLADNNFAPPSDVIPDTTTGSSTQTTGDSASGAGNAMMWAKAAYDVSNKLNESGVMPSEVATGPTMNMNTSGINMANNQVAGPLGKKNLEEDEDPYNKNMSAFAPLGGNRYGI